MNGRTAIGLGGYPAGSGLVRAPLSFALMPAPAETVGMSSEALEHVDSIIEEALLAGAAPGAAIAVGRLRPSRQAARLRHARFPSGSRPASDSTIYDLASLTKVVATTTQP
jgi:CubicO group peptidase (beta-lactamase class C family)